MTSFSGSQKHIKSADFWRVALLAFMALAWLTLPARGAQAASLRPDLADLLANADLVARGRVVHIASFWNADRTLIESDVTLRVTDSIVGAAPPEVVIRTLGGYLPDEGLGMAASEVAHFTPGEDALVFLRQADGVWRVVGGEHGKYEVSAPVAIHHPSGAAVPLAALVERIALLARGEPLPADPLPTLPPDLTFRPAAYVINGQKWPGGAPMGEPFVVNINSVHAGGGNGSADQFRHAILSAAAAWNQVAGANFQFVWGGMTNATRTGYNGHNEVLFAPDEFYTGALAQSQWWFDGSGYIVEADIWFNDAYVWNATGAPGGHAFDLQSVALHEFGHWLSLGHDSNPAAVMHGVIMEGAIRRSLHPNDIAGIQSIYPAPIVPTATPTATPTPLPTATPTPLPTATPTLRPTATPLAVTTPIHLSATVRLWLPLLQR